MLRAPWKPGEHGNKSGTIGEYQRTVGLARQTSMRAMETIISRLDSDDDRVALVAAQAVLERAWGKPREPSPDELEKTGARLDFSRLTRDELMLLLKITQSGAIRPADEVSSETIEGEATAAGDTLDAAAKPP